MNKIVGFLKIFIGLIGFSKLVLANSNDILLVGSTFDYPPLTYYESGLYRGDDVSLIQKFAKDTNKTIKFIQTTWYNLSNDLLAHKFDIAVGGISENPQRKSLFLLSNPVAESRKVALIRCSDLNKFAFLSVINDHKTIVVENKGGTNEIFAKQTVPKAKLVVVNNNQIPFEYLLNKKADVMFTDDIEANYKHRLLPSLCVAKFAMHSPISFKVFLFNKNKTGEILRDEFNAWYKKTLATGYPNSTK